MLLATTTESSQRRSLGGSHWLWFTSDIDPPAPTVFQGAISRPQPEPCLRTALGTGDFAIQVRADAEFSVLAAIPSGLRWHAKVTRTIEVAAYGLQTHAFDFGRAFWRGSRVAKSTYALGTGPNVVRRLRLRVDRLRLRIADRLGQHPVQVSLGRC